MSRTSAIRGGTPQLKGWDNQTVILARLHNLMASLLMGLSGGKGGDDIFVKFPKAPEQEAPEMKTLADFSVAGFNKFMYGEG